MHVDGVSFQSADDAIAIGSVKELPLDAAEMELTCSTFEESHGSGRFHINVVLIPLVHLHDTPPSEAGVHIVMAPRQPPWRKILPRSIRLRCPRAGSGFLGYRKDSAKAVGCCISHRFGRAGIARSVATQVARPISGRNVRVARRLPRIGPG